MLAQYNGSKQIVMPLEMTTDVLHDYIYDFKPKFNKLMNMYAVVCQLYIAELYVGLRMVQILSSRAWLYHRQQIIIFNTLGWSPFINSWYKI